MPAPVGNTQGLKPSQLRALERLYQRRYPPDAAFSPEQGRELALLSAAIKRQIGILIDRRGKGQLVIVGDASSIFIPELPPLAAGGKVLRGWRLLHTHLGSETLSREDLMDMLFLRLDAVISLGTNACGEPGFWQGAWLEPEKSDSPYSVQKSRPWHDAELDFSALFDRLDASFAKNELPGEGGAERAFLISVSPAPQSVQEDNLDELAELARADGLEVAGRLVQRAPSPDPRMILGKGKMAELEVLALSANAGLLIFDGELTPAQLHNLADITERKVMDRTQLILDIFARHAKTAAGKLQVEMAQLAYAQPRLAGKRTALDRLAGGIGGRGPGETRLETDRRKSRQRQRFLRQALEKLRKQRGIARERRARNNMPIAALVGYTSAGKSALLNRLTGSDTLVDDKLFATLDPGARRLQWSPDSAMILTDTVGFIRDLPQELAEAFRATLEELESADILIHVADASHAAFEQRLVAVNAILEDLGLLEKPLILVLNKCDRLAADAVDALLQAHPGAVAVSAINGAGLNDLLKRLEQELLMLNTTGKRDEKKGNHSGNSQSGQGCGTSGPAGKSGPDCKNPG